MASDDEPTISAREVRIAYNELIQARKQYRRAVGTGLEANAHEQLHNAVFDLYDVVRPLIKHANSTEQLWSEEELWPTGRRVVDAAVCPECHTAAELDRRGDLCPECGLVVLERGEAPAVDEDGEPVYVWQRGLRSLDGLRDRVRVVEQSYSDALGEHTSQRVEKQLLDPTRLVTVADLLDEALERLGLLADVDDDAPMTELDQEDLDAFRDRLAELAEEAWSDHDDVDLDAEEVNA